MHRTPADGLADLVRSRIEVGDALLTGGSDPISRVIQIGSRSPFSHAAIVTGEDELTEAYDYALTPSEEDDGVFALAVEKFLERTGMRRILILRPVDVDRRQVQKIASHFREHSPGFPTVGMACLAMCGASAPLLRQLPDGLQHRWVMRQVRMAADGIRRVHCAETVARIYLGAGVVLRFRTPRLQLHIDHLHGHLKGSSDRPDPLRLPQEPRLAVAGSWPAGRGIRSLGEQLGFVVESTIDTWRERSRADDDVDIADLLLPGDFARAEPFETVANLVFTRRGWVEIPMVVPFDPAESDSSIESDNLPDPVMSSAFTPIPVWE